MALPDCREIQVFKYVDGTITSIKISLSCEYVFTVRINGSPYSEVACSGSGIKDFAVGYMFSNNIISLKNDILDISIDESRKEINITTDLNEKILNKLLSIKFVASGCGQGSKIINDELTNINLPTLNASLIIKIMSEFIHHSDIHKLTHGVHSSALYSIKGEMIAFYDDIGRHNAIDKLIGFSVQKSILLDDKIMVSTGRLASEIVLKAINARIPVIISMASTTTRGFELASKYNIILIGRARGSSFIVFNGNEYVF